jgi:hypothetical protein
MKYLLTTLLFVPIYLFSQNIGIGTVEPREKLEVNGIIFTSQGGVKFPDGTVQTTAYMPPPGMMQMGLSGLVMELAPSSGIVGPGDGPFITGGLNISSAQEGMGVAVSQSGGVLTGSAPILGEISVSRSADSNSAQFRNLVNSRTVIPYIEVFNLRLVNGLFYVDHISRYETCMLSSFSSSSSGESSPSESISFSFVKACYRAYKRDPETGAEISFTDTCYDQSNMETGCSCSF